MNLNPTPLSVEGQEKLAPLEHINQLLETLRQLNEAAVNYLKITPENCQDGVDLVYNKRLYSIVDYIASVGKLFPFSRTFSHTDKGEAAKGSTLLTEVGHTRATIEFGPLGRTFVSVFRNEKKAWSNLHDELNADPEFGPQFAHHLIVLVENFKLAAAQNFGKSVSITDDVRQKISQHFGDLIKDIRVYGL